MLKTIIIDDELNTREVLTKLLQDYCPEVKVIATASSVSEGLQAIAEHKPDLVFLDVEFPGQSGFDLLGDGSPLDYDIIFISGYQEYAIQAFKTDATDYLLKPFNIEELEKAVEKVMQKRKKEAHYKHAEILMQNWSESQENQIALSSSDGYLFVKIKDIIYCKGDGAYTYFYLTNQDRITVSKNLKEFETLLSGYGFFRVHKSYLINLTQMKRYVRGDGGYVVMVNGDSVDVSKRRKEAFVSGLAKI